MKSKHLLFFFLLMALFAPWAAKAQQTIPYTEGFESMSSADDLTTAGWISYRSHSGSILKIETTAGNVHSGSKALNMDSNKASNNSDYFVVGLPIVGAAINTLQITFSYMISSSYGGSEDSFAFFSNGNLIVNNDGNATLQVIDVNGRILCNETFNGSVSKAINAAPGVYMIRLINGENVKIQKIMVR